jgi:glucosamine-phosphate N-acetyltransferase
MNFVIRELEITDYNKNYLQLLSQLTQIDPSKISQNEFEKFVTDLKSTDTHKIFVVEDDDKIIATATILVEYKLIRNMGKVGHIEDVVVDSEYRLHGIGKQIISYVISYAKLKGCYKCILDCDENNTNFYEKNQMKRKGVCMAKYFD